MTVIEKNCDNCDRDRNWDEIHPTVYIAIKGLYTLLLRCIDPCNNRGVWVDKYAINMALLNVPRPTVGYHAATILWWVGCIFARTHFGFSY